MYSIDMAHSRELSVPPSCICVVRWEACTTSAHKNIFKKSPFTLLNTFHIYLHLSSSCNTCMYEHVYAQACISKYTSVFISFVRKYLNSITYISIHVIITGTSFYRCSKFIKVFPRLSLPILPFHTNQSPFPCICNQQFQGTQSLHLIQFLASYPLCVNS